MKSTYKVERRVRRREGSILQGRLGKSSKRGGARFRFMEKQMQREG